MRWQKKTWEDGFKQSIFYNGTEHIVKNPCWPAKVVRSVLYVDIHVDPLNPNCGLALEMVSVISLLIKLF